MRRSNWHLNTLLLPLPLCGSTFFIPDPALCTEDWPSCRRGPPLAGEKIFRNFEQFIVSYSVIYYLYTNVNFSEKHPNSRHISLSFKVHIRQWLCVLTWHLFTCFRSHNQCTLTVHSVLFMFQASTNLRALSS